MGLMSSVRPYGFIIHLFCKGYKTLPTTLDGDFPSLSYRLTSNRTSSWTCTCHSDVQNLEDCQIYQERIQVNCIRSIWHPSVHPMLMRSLVKRKTLGSIDEGVSMLLRFMSLGTGP